MAFPSFLRLWCFRTRAWCPSSYMLQVDLADRDKLVRRRCDGDRRHFACHFDIDRFSHGRSRSKLPARLRWSVPPSPSSEFLPFHPSPKADRAEVKSGDKSFFPGIGDGRTPRTPDVSKDYFTQYRDLHSFRRRVPSNRHPYRPRRMKRSPINNAMAPSPWRYVIRTTQKDMDAGHKGRKIAAYGRR